jgi:hypothetical protein
MNDLNDLVQSGYSELKDVKTYDDILKANSIGMRDGLSGLFDKSKMYSEVLQYLLKSDGKAKFNSYMQAVRAFEKGVSPENIEKTWKDFIESITKVPQSFRVSLDESFELLNEKVKKCKDEKERYESSLADYSLQKYLFDMGAEDLAGGNKDLWLKFKGVEEDVPEVKHVLKIFDLIDGLNDCKSKEQIKEHIGLLRENRVLDKHIKEFYGSIATKLETVKRGYFKIEPCGIDNYKDQLNIVYIDLKQLLVNSIISYLPKGEPIRPQAALEEGQDWDEELSQLLHVMRLQFNQEELSILAGEIESFEFKPCSKVLMDCFLDLKAADNQKQGIGIVSKTHIDGLLDKLDKEIKSCNDQLKGSYEWMKIRKGEGDFNLNSIQQSLFIDGLLNIDKMSESIFSVFLKSKAFDSCSSKSFDDICKYIDRSDITKAQKIRMQKVLYRVLDVSPDKLIDDKFILSVEDLNRVESKSSERFKPTLDRVFDHYPTYMSEDAVAESNFQKAVMAYPSQWVCYLLAKYNTKSLVGFSNILDLESKYLDPFKLKFNDIKVLGGGLSPDDGVDSYKNMQDKGVDKTGGLRGFLLKDVLGSGFRASKEFKQKVGASSFDDFYRLSRFSGIYTRLKAVVFLAAHYPKKSLQECFKKIKSPKQMSWSDIPMFVVSLWTNLSVRSLLIMTILSSCTLVVFNLASLFAASVGAGSLLLCKLSGNKLMSIDDGVLTISVGSSRAVKWLSGAAKESYNEAIKISFFIKSYSFDPVFNLLPIKFKSTPLSAASVKFAVMEGKGVNNQENTSLPVNNELTVR